MAKRIDGLLATVTELDVVGSGAHPQLRQWQPERTGQIDISIKRNGDWFHEGVRIDRQRMVQLFASIMRKDSDGYTYLVTPYERLRIDVEDAAFNAVLVEQQFNNAVPELRFTLNTGDQVIATVEHPITVIYSSPDSEPAPYLDVRFGLRALITRAVFYQLVDYAEQRGNELGVVSAGTFMCLGHL